jgi:hypothetical protein
MKLNKLIFMMIATMALTLSGCGGDSSNGVQTPAVNNTVSGVASKGLIKNGSNNVKVYALNSDGTKGSLLATTSTGANGEYSAVLGSYSGAVLVEVSGTYTDEATGQPVTISVDKPLRAACDNVSGSVTVAVTPLTELAVQKAGSTLTVDNIKAANTQVSTLFNMNIITTQPVDATATALGSASQAQKDYTLALAAISQMANSGTADAVHAVIATIVSDIAANNTLTTTATQFTQALENFTANSNNQTGVTSSTIPVGLVNVGSKTAVVKLSVSGISETIYGVEVTLDLPSGVTVVADANGSVSASVLSAGGSVTGSPSMLAKYTPASDTTSGKVRIALMSSGGFSTGEFIAISLAVAQGVTPTFSNTLLESGAKVANADGVGISGAALTLNSSF